MSLNSRALALQGFLLTPIAMAVHGLLEVLAAGGVNTDTSQGAAGGRDMKGYIDRLAREEYNRANRLAKDDALVVDLLTALFTGGFFDGRC